MAAQQDTELSRIGRTVLGGAAGGLGVITPDLVPDEGAAWLDAAVLDRSA